MIDIDKNPLRWSRIILASWYWDHCRPWVFPSLWLWTKILNVTFEICQKKLCLLSCYRFFFLSRFFPLGCHNKLPQPGQLARDIYFLTVLEVKILRASCQEDHALLKSVKENLFPAFLLTSGVTKDPWQSFPCVCITRISALVITWFFPPWVRVSVQFSPLIIKTPAIVV